MKWSAWIEAVKKVGACESDGITTSNFEMWLNSSQIKIFHSAPSKLISFLFFWIVASINLTLGNDGNDTIMCNHCLNSVSNTSVPLCGDCTALYSLWIWSVSIVPCQDQVQKSVTFHITSVKATVPTLPCSNWANSPIWLVPAEAGVKAWGRLSGVCCFPCFHST